MASRRGKRKRPLVEEEEEEDDDDDAFGEGGEVVMEGGRESYVNGLLKQLIKVCMWYTSTLYVHVHVHVNYKIYTCTCM